MKCSFESPADKSLSSRLVVDHCPEKIISIHVLQKILISSNCSFGNVGSSFDIHVKNFEIKADGFCSICKSEKKTIKKIFSLELFSRTRKWQF